MEGAAAFIAEYNRVRFGRPEDIHAAAVLRGRLEQLHLQAGRTRRGVNTAGEKNVGQQE